MKVSKEQLKALIKEELDAVMKEAESEELEEGQEGQEELEEARPYQHKVYGSKKEKDAAKKERRKIRSKEDYAGFYDETEEAEDHAADQSAAAKKNPNVQAKKAGLEKRAAQRADAKKKGLRENELEETEMTEMKGLDTLDPKHSEMALQARQDRGRLISDKDFYDDGGNQRVSEWIEETLELLNVDPASPEGMALEQKLRDIAKEHVLDDEDELGENKLGLEEKEDKQMEQISESFRRFTKILKG